MSVAVTAVSTLGDEHSLVRGGEIVKKRFRLIVADHGADGNPDLDVLAVFPAFVATLAVLSARCAKHMVEAEFEERVLLRLGNDVDVATVTAVTTARSAAR